MKNQRKLGATLSYLAIILNVIVQISYTPLLIKYLGQSSYGLYSLVSSVIGYLTILDLGFGNAIIVQTSKYRAEENYEKMQKLHGMFALVYKILAIIVTIIGIYLSLNVDKLFKNTMSISEITQARNMLLILCINIFFTFFFNIYSSIIIAFERFTFDKILVLIGILLKPIISILFLLQGYKAISLCISITIINLIIVVSRYFYCKKNLGISTKFNGFDILLFKDIFGYSLFIFLGVIADQINWSVDQFILGAVSGTVAVSIYSVAKQLNTLFVNLSSTVSSILLPKVSTLVAKKEKLNVLTQEMIKVGRLQFYLIFMLISLFIISGKDFIVWWVGNEYIESYYVTLFLIIPVSVPLIQNIAISIIQAMNKHKFRAIMLFMMSIFNIFISYYLSKSYGAVGAAAGTAISLIVCNIIIMNLYYARNIGLNMILFWKSIFKILIPNIILFILFLVFVKYIENMNLLYISGIIKIIIVSSFYMFLYSFVNLKINFNDYEKSLIYNFYRNIKSKI